MSDGTNAGTLPVLNTKPAGYENFSPGILLEMNGRVYFTISGHSYNDQLWTTDGTASGTILIKDFYSTDPEESYSDVTELSVIKNKLYFKASRLSFDYFSRLWVSNGSTNGTHVISKTIKEPAQLFAGSSNPLDSLVYFAASSNQNSKRSLFVTNGDSGSAIIPNGFNGTISNVYYEVEIIKSGDVIYFVGTSDSPSNVQTLYKFNVTVADGVQPIKIVSGTNAIGHNSGIKNLFQLNGILLFNVYDAPSGKYQLWKSDGTAAGNSLLKDGFNIGETLDVNGVLYFSGDDIIHGFELWKTDGTINGTLLVKDIQSGFDPSYPGNLTKLNNKILFAATDSLHGTELWQSDGTSGGTSLLKDINKTTTASSFFLELGALNQSLIFTTSPAKGNKVKIWKSNGTETGTTVVSDTVFVISLFGPSFLTLNNNFYFFGISVSGRSGLYRVDASSGETILVYDFTGLPYTFSGLKSTGNLIYFYLFNHSNSSFEIWKTNGTKQNTFIIKNNSVFFEPADLASADSTLFFVYKNDHSLWKTDGTVAGTVMLKSFANNPYASNPVNLTIENGILYFSVNEGTLNNLWKSDGTPAGTVKVTKNVTEPGNFIISNGELFFTAKSYAGAFGDIGVELFKTDGTEKGTMLVKDIRPGVSNTILLRSISIDNLLYFFIAGENNSGVELWKSNGSTTGTQLIASVGNGSGQSPSQVVSCNGKLIFLINNTLWESDGSKVGTHAVADDIFADVTFNGIIQRLFAVGDQLYFAGNNYKYGSELYVGNISPANVPKFITAANGNWSDPATWQGNVVPTEGAYIIVRHNLTVNVNTTCYGLWAEEPGGLTVGPGITFTVLH